MTVQIATRVDERDAAAFRDYARRLGTTPSDALRIFIAAFNEHRGFPFDIRLEQPAAGSLQTGEEAANYPGRPAMGVSNDAR